jgi:serine/threonine-protein kinase
MMAMSAAIAAAALAIGWYAATVRESGITAPRPLSSEMMPTPPDAFAGRAPQQLFTFTPDAGALIYTTAGGPARRIYRRDRNAAVGVAVAGTEGGFAPFVSPDGAWLGFLADGKLQRVPIGGGTPQVIHDLQSPTAPDAAATGWGTGTVTFGAAWLPDDTIVYGRIAGGLWRVPASGGTPVALTRVNDGEIAHRHPHVLPGGRTLLFSVIRNLIVGAESSVEALDLQSGRRTRLVENATDARYHDGFLLFAREGSLYSVRLDVASLSITGQPARLGEVMHAVAGNAPASSSGVAQFDISSDGTLALVGGGALPKMITDLAWVRANGATEAVPLEAGSYIAPRLSPDGSRFVIMTVLDRSVVVGTTDLLPTSVGSAIFPVWAPDGASLFAAVRRNAVHREIHRIRLADDTRELIVAGAHLLWPSHVSRDGRWLAYVETHPVTGNDIWMVELGAQRTPVAVLATPANETHPMFSPDGRWLLYLSDSYLYVRPFPGPGREARIWRTPQVNSPVWAPDGRSVFFFDYSDGSTRIMRLPVDASGDRVTVGNPSVVASGRFGLTTPVGGFDVTPDGSRLLVTLGAPPPPSDAAKPAALQIIVHADLSGGARQ